jgi:hypothetical protein
LTTNKNIILFSKKLRKNRKYKFINCQKIILLKIKGNFQFLKQKYIIFFNNFQALARPRAGRPDRRGRVARSRQRKCADIGFA